VLQVSGWGFGAYVLGFKDGGSELRVFCCLGTVFLAGGLRFRIWGLGFGVSDFEFLEIRCRGSGFLLAHQSDCQPSGHASSPAMSG
jgi:hypothetical protein